MLIRGNDCRKRVLLGAGALVTIAALSAQGARAQTAAGNVGAGVTSQGTLGTGAAASGGGAAPVKSAQGMFGDIKLNWTNTIQYTLSGRVRSQNPELLAQPNNDDGDRNFTPGIVSNRIDVLSELDATYHENLGARVSVAGWYDSIYNTRNANPGFPGGAFPSQQGADTNQYTATTRRLEGRDIELRDAFASYKFNVSGMLGSVRLGQYALVWGESLFFASNAIAGAQNAFDIGRLLADPTAQAKDFVLPVPQISTELQINSDVSVAAYYQFSWRPNRYPAVGSYFSTSDLFGPGGEILYSGPGQYVARGSGINPLNGGQFGVRLSWNVMDTDVGLYFLRTNDKTPEIITRIGLTRFGPQPIGYYQAYNRDVKVVALSASHTFGDANVAFEASFRDRQGLASSGNAVDLTALLSAVQGRAVAPDNTYDRPAYAVGKTMHANISTIYTLDPSRLWREANFVAEAAWNRLVTCDLNCAALDSVGTKDAYGLRFVFTPLYRQVISGLDLGVPFGVGYAPPGSRSLALGPGSLPPDNGGDITIAVDGTYQNAWTARLAYTHFFGHASPLNSAAPALASAPPFTYGQSLGDRDFVTLTVRRSL